MVVSELVISSRVGNLPYVSYIPNYVTEAEDERILGHVHASKASWTKLSGRRLQNHGGLVHAKGLLQSPMPSWLGPLLARLHEDTGVYGELPPNHVLINAYQPGEGIMAHEDGPAYCPGVCILSLGGPAVIRFSRKPADGGPVSLDAAPDASVLLMPRSLLVFSDDAYTCCLHHINEVHEEQLDPSVANLHLYPQLTPGSSVPRAPERISLTVRRVEKVVKSVIRLGAR